MGFYLELFGSGVVKSLLNRFVGQLYTTVYSLEATVKFLGNPVANITVIPHTFATLVYNDNFMALAKAKINPATSLYETIDRCTKITTPRPSVNIFLHKFI